MSNDFKPSGLLKIIHREFWGSFNGVYLKSNFGIKNGINSIYENNCNK